MINTLLYLVPLRIVEYPVQLPLRNMPFMNEIFPLAYQFSCLLGLDSVEGRGITYV